MQSIFDEDFFGEDLIANFENIIQNLTWLQLTVNSVFVRYADFDHFAGFKLDHRRYTLLKNCYNNLKKKQGDWEGEPVEIATFFSKIKKGSKHFRKIFTDKKNKLNFYATNTTVKSFCKTAEIDFGNEAVWERSLGAWNTFCFPNRLKVFLFKYYSNILGTGNRVIHFNRDSDPSCIFCTRSNLLPPPIETFAHIFFDCPEVAKIITTFSNKYFNEEIGRNKYFNGYVVGSKLDKMAVNVVLDILRYSIWQSKLLKNKISYYTIELETINLLETITASSNKIKNAINQCSFINTDGNRQQRGQPRP